MSALLPLLAKESMSVAALEGLYAGLRTQPMLPDDAVAAMRLLDADYAWRAVWLLRRIARDRPLGDEIWTRIAAAADELTHWAARLTLCQLVAEADCPRAAREELHSFLVACVADRRVIVRAWAISGLVPLADDTRFRGEILGLLKQARRDPAKSMQARLRHLTVPALRKRF